jgi:hypothetical protein
VLHQVKSADNHLVIAQVVPRLPHVCFSNMCDQVEPCSVHDKVDWSWSQHLRIPSLIFLEFLSSFMDLNPISNRMPIVCCLISTTILCAMNFQWRLTDKLLLVCFTQEVASSSVWVKSDLISTTCSTDSCCQREETMHMEPDVFFCQLSSLLLTSLISSKWYLLYSLEKQRPEILASAWNCLMLSLIWTGVTCFSTPKSLSLRISGRDSFKGGRAVTPQVLLQFQSRLWT